MNVSEYKGILFIEGKVDCKIIDEDPFNLDISGFGNQLKNFADLKESVYRKLKQANKNYNVVYNFQYYQKQSILALDDIVFHASGHFALVDQEDYFKYKNMINNSSLEQLFSIRNNLFYRSMPVQIDKIALYKLKNKYLGQCKLINFSMKEIRTVKLEAQSINSFGELSGKINYFEITRKKEDSNFSFGDDKTIVFEESDVADFKIKINTVITSTGEIAYDENNKEAIERFVPFSTRLDDDQFKYLKFKKFNEIFKHYNVDINSNIPRLYKNTIIDFDGNFIDTYNPELLSIEPYISDKLMNDFNLFMKEEQEKEQIRKQKEEVKKEQINKLKNKLKIVFPVLIVIFICVWGTVTLIRNSNKTSVEKFESLTFDSLVDSFSETDLNLIDYTDKINRKSPGAGRVECDKYYLIMKDNMEVGHFYKGDNIFELEFSYINTQDDAANEKYFLNQGSNLNTLSISYLKVDEEYEKHIKFYFMDSPQKFEGCLEEEVLTSDDDILSIIYTIDPYIDDCLKKADLLSKEESNERGYKVYEDSNERMYLDSDEEYLSYDVQVSMPKILE